MAERASSFNDDQVDLVLCTSTRTYVTHHQCVNYRYSFLATVSL